MHEYVNRLHFNYRDHRKIACIDGDVAYTGGVNIADEYANLIDASATGRTAAYVLKARAPGA